MSMQDNNMPAPPALLSPLKLGLSAGIMLLVIASFVSLNMEWRALFSDDAAGKTWEFLQGFAPQVLVSRAARSAREQMLDELGIVLPRGEEIDIRVLERAGVPRDRIAIFGTASLSTYEEGKVLGGLYAGSSPRLLVVTSPYHVRRARMILESALPNAKLSVVATPYEAFPERWWTSQDAARDLLLEIAKLAFYGAGGRFTSPGQ